MQRITTFSPGISDLSSLITLLTIRTPPVGGAWYRLRVRVYSLDVGAQLVIQDDRDSQAYRTQKYVPAQTGTTFDRDYFFDRTEHEIVVSMEDESDLSTNAVVSGALYRLDDPTVPQPSQAVPIGSTTPLLFRFSGAPGTYAGTPAVTIRKNGGGLVSPVGTVAHLGSGVWALTPTAGDTDTAGSLVISATVSNTDNSSYSETQRAFHTVGGQGDVEVNITNTSSE